MTWLTYGGTAVVLLTGLIGLGIAGVHFIVTIADALDAIRDATDANRQTTVSLRRLNRRVKRVEHHLGFRADQRDGKDRRLAATTRKQASHG